MDFKICNAFSNYHILICINPITKSIMILYVTGSMCLADSMKKEYEENEKGNRAYLIIKPFGETKIEFDKILENALMSEPVKGSINEGAENEKENKV